nr:hypothetical protein [Tanacetum cinerariifolium]GEZ63104.1 hypothetical protein [Tanacetum cinerariifolium]
MMFKTLPYVDQPGWEEFIASVRTLGSQTTCDLFSTGSGTYRDGSTLESNLQKAYSLGLESDSSAKETAELKGTKTVEGEMLGTMETKLETIVNVLHIRKTQTLWLPLMERILTGHDIDCRAKGNQDSRRRDVGYNGNKARDNSRRHAYQEDSNALVTVDGEDIDWSGHVDEDAKNYAMMAYSNSSFDNE